MEMISREITMVRVGCGNSAIHYKVLDKKEVLFHFYHCHKIKDASFNDGKMHSNIFIGYDKDEKVLFQIINQPVTVEYERNFEKIERTEDDDIPF